MKTCKQCGTQFKPEKVWHTYCSMDCWGADKDEARRAYTKHVGALAKESAERYGRAKGLLEAYGVPFEDRGNRTLLIGSPNGPAFFLWPSSSKYRLKGTTRIRQARDLREAVDTIVTELGYGLEVRDFIPEIIGQLHLN